MNRCSPWCPGYVLTNDPQPGDVDVCPDCEAAWLTARGL